MPAHFRPTARSNASLACLLLAATALSACANPDLGPMPQPRPGESYAAAQSLAAPAAEWPADAWWAAYGDAQLTALIEEGLAGSPTMTAAQARVRRAEALEAQAGAALQPQVGAQAQANTAIVDLGGLAPKGGGGPSGLTTAGFGLLRASYDFDVWGRNRAALAAARGEAEATRADAAQARLTLSTAIAAAYADLAQLYDGLDAADEAITVRRRTVQLLGERQEQGLENRGSVSQAEAGQAQAQAERAAIEESIALSKNRIAALAGAGPDRGLAIQRPGEATVKAFGLPAQLQANLVGRRPDIVAARLRAEAAASRIKEAKTGFYPNVNLSGMAGGLLMDLLNPASPPLFAAVGPAINLPIFGGGRVEAQVRQSRAEYDAAVADYDRLVVQAFQEVADVAVSERALAQRLESRRAAVTASEDAYRVAGERFRGGLSNLLDVLRTEDTLIANRRALSDLQARAFVLDIALIRALGGGYGS
jgi:NodT family efflux transporter outer membrane factor (OMF) lipoprotein